MTAERLSPLAAGSASAGLDLAGLETLQAELLSQMADMSDQVVFLQRLIPRVLSLTSESQAAELVREAAGLLNTPCAALYLDGRWLGEVPGWLPLCPAPQQPRVVPAGQLHTGTPYRDAWRATALLGVPFARGWVALWGKRQFQAGERRLIEAFVNLLDAALQAARARQEAVQHAAEQRDRAQAHAVWRAVIPTSMDDPPGYLIRLFSRPASDFGGDFQFKEGEWLVVGDVSGKGLPAAIFTAMFAATLPVAAQHRDLAGALCESLHRHLERGQSFCTLAALRLSESGGVRVLNLGHPPALLRRTDGALEAFPAQAPPLGTFPVSGLPGVQVWLHPGDQLMLYSDGLSEAESAQGDQLGLEAVQQLVVNAGHPSVFLSSALAALQRYRVTDDLTLLGVQRDPCLPGVVRHLPGQLDALAQLGEALREVADEDHPALPGAELSVTELAVNAIRHGGAGRITLRAHADREHLYVTLTDDGAPYDPTLEPTGPAGELREHGYGLLIARRCAPVWHYDRVGALNRQTLRLSAPLP